MGTFPKQRQAAPAGNTATVELTVWQGAAAVVGATGTVTVYEDDVTPIGAPLPVVYVGPTTYQGHPASVYHAVAPSTVFQVDRAYKCFAQLDAPDGSHAEYELWAFGIVPDLAAP